MNHQQSSEMETMIVKDSQLLDEIFKPVWEKIRRAAELIQELREEKGRLSERISDMEISTSHRIENLEGELKSLRQELTLREQELKRVKAENSQLSSTNGREIFSIEEKEILKDRIRELIAKINSHL